MKISIITLFPDMFSGPFDMSMLKKAQDNNLLELEFIDLRDFGVGPRRQVDDSPYGGGDGMVLRPEPVVEAIEQVLKQSEFSKEETKVILLTPRGDTYIQSAARDLVESKHLVLICGHYEGFDERIVEFVDLQVSIGDYVLTGGEIPAMVLVDSVVRLIPGVLGGERSAIDESFSDDQTLEHPHYTRPEEFRGQKVPEVLLSGNHQEIAKWRQDNSIAKN